MIQALVESVQSRLGGAQVAVTPNSVVKELVENALDAGALNVDVRVSANGLQQIQVKDTGSGVPSADIPALCARSATSKLKDFEDLVNVSTYGFRGEALHSIVEVAEKTVVTTRTSEESVARRYEFDKAGTVISETDIAGSVGTTVTVENLFKWLPVRRQEAIKLILKGNLTDHLQMISADAPITSSTLCVRVEAIVPKADADVSVVARSSYARTFVYINRRPVNPKSALDKTPKRAVKLIKDAFFGIAGSDSRSKELFIWLHIHIPSHLVDINLEPNKTSVASPEDLILPCIQKLVEQAYPPAPSMPTPFANTAAAGTPADMGGANATSNESPVPNGSSAVRRPPILFEDEDIETDSMVPQLNRETVESSIAPLAEIPRQHILDHVLDGGATVDLENWSTGRNLRAAAGLAGSKSPPHTRNETNRPTPAGSPPSSRTNAAPRNVARDRRSPERTQPTLAGFLSGDHTAAPSPAKSKRPRKSVSAYESPNPKRSKTDHPAVGAYIEMESVDLNYHSIKASYLRIARRSQHECLHPKRNNLRVVGPVIYDDDAAWAFSLGRDIILLNIKRLWEVVHFESLRSHHQLPTDTLRIPKCIPARSLGPEVAAWLENGLQLGRFPQSEMEGASLKYKLDDPRITMNGFEVFLREELDEIILEITAISSVVEGYGEEDLPALLRSIALNDGRMRSPNRTPPTSTQLLTKSRPPKLIAYFEEQSKRLAEQECVIPSGGGGLEGNEKMVKAVQRAAQLFFAGEGRLKADSWGT
ncbi:ATP-binding mismatch repair protein [Rhizophlyctis rosea]|nr:ATP-binding mismatch repair protein [Rhizophlyctis rosea]